MARDFRRSLAVIKICIKAAVGRRAAKETRTCHKGVYTWGREKGAGVFRTCVLSHYGGIAMRGTRFRKTWGARKSQASRVLPSPSRTLARLVSFTRRLRAGCFLIPWPNSCSRETLIDIPRFERGISRAEITFPLRQTLALLRIVPRKNR